MGTDHSVEKGWGGAEVGRREVKGGEGIEGHL